MLQSCLKTLPKNTWQMLLIPDLFLILNAYHNDTKVIDATIPNGIKEEKIKEKTDDYIFRFCNTV